MPHVLRTFVAFACASLLAGCFRGYGDPPKEHDDWVPSYNQNDYNYPDTGSYSPPDYEVDAGSDDGFCSQFFPGAHNCPDGCFQLDTDSSHCGDCDNACAAGEVCSKGECTSSCAAGTTYCPAPCDYPFADPDTCGACIDTDSDSFNCGACGNVCPGDRACKDGTCDVCASGLVSCDDSCVDLKWDSAHCGVCGKACADGQVCSRGACKAPKSEWRTLGFDMTRSGYNPIELGVPPLKPAWAKSVLPNSLNQVVIAEGRVLVTSSSDALSGASTIVALDTKTGDPVWTRELGKSAKLSPPTVVDGRVYVEAAADDGGSTTGSQMWALDAASGKPAWSQPIVAQDFWPFWAPTVTKDSVYVDGGDYGGQLYGLSRASGREIFLNTELDEQRGWVVTVQGNYLYTYVNGRLRRHDPQTGSIQKTISALGASGTTRGAPVSPDGVAYLSAQSTLSVFDVDSSSLLWKASIGITNVPALAEGLALAYVDARLTAFDATTGAVVWTAAETEDLTALPPVAAHGFAYVGGATSTYAIDLKDGSVVWQTEAAGWLSLAEGKLFVASGDGLLYAFNLTVK